MSGNNNNKYVMAELIEMRCGPSVTRTTKQVVHLEISI